MSDKYRPLQKHSIDEAGPFLLYSEDGPHVGAVVSTLTSKQEGPLFDFWVGQGCLAV